MSLVNVDRIFDEIRLGDALLKNKAAFLKSYYTAIREKSHPEHIARADELVSVWERAENGELSYQSALMESDRIYKSLTP